MCASLLVDSVGPDLSIDSATSALVVFDMLNAFVKDDPMRAAKAEPAIGRCRELLAQARGRGMPVFYANSLHRPDYRDYGATLTDAGTDLTPWPNGPRLMGKPPGIEGTPGAEVIEELFPQPEDFIVPKNRWSAFAGTALDILLRGIGTKTILLSGGATDIGILSTACSARDLGYHLVVLRDACHSPRDDGHEFCMSRLFPRMARVMSTDEAIQLLT